ncbi:hypothetical protein ACIRPK_00025 [Kitasatospora sp. NPDC101801]|uniref:hypothetical protein n=1 Tax=Kitasatospora sp. NPDC101801 TaxID=3364103 RepID=UPI003811C652
MSVRPAVGRGAIGLLAGALLVGGVATGAEAAPKPRLALTALAFAEASVDATTGNARATVEWTVADNQQTATNVAGNVVIQQLGRDGRPVGAAYPVSFAFQRKWDTKATLVSGTAQSATYRYAFPVPRYAAVDHATWAVVGLTAADDRGTELSLGRARLGDFHNSFTATELTDTTGPGVEGAYVVYGQPVYRFLDGRPVAVSYEVIASDHEAGVYSGELTVRGPGGGTATGGFTIERSNGVYTCGPGTGNGDTEEVRCRVDVQLPATAAVGDWKITRVRLTDNAGNVAVHRDQALAPVHLTRNEQLKATELSVSPKVFDNWRDSTEVVVSLKPVGLRGTVVEATVLANGACDDQKVEAPALEADGTLKVRLWVPPGYSDHCTVTGLALLDSSGRAAAYGTAFGGPALELTSTRLPDSTDPVATSAVLSGTEFRTSEMPMTLGLAVEASSPVGITQASFTIYDAAGRSVGGENGGAAPAADGKFHLGFHGYLAPGSYTAGFTVTSAGGRSAMYGYPGGAGLPAPSGPLAFTVIEG